MTRPTSDDAAAALLVPKFDKYGGRLCWWPPCKNRLKGRKRKWCSEECASNAWASYNFAPARGRVFERDRGICAHCGLNCPHLTEALDWVHDYCRHRKLEFWKGYRYEYRLVVELMQALGIGANRKIGDDLWEADHIIPLVEGGKLCELTNLRTLCFRCHRVETAALATRRAKAKRIATKHRFGYVPLRFQGGVEIK